MTTSPSVGPSTYSHPNSWEHAGRRLHCLEQLYDAGTTRRLAALGAGPGLRCLEAGAGSGSIAEWLSAAVGPTGAVLAVDLDTTLLAHLRAPNVTVCAMDLRYEAPPVGVFDLVHARATLTHIPERDAVLDALVTALAPGGWLLLEEADAPTTLGRCEGPYVRLMNGLLACITEAGADLHWARDLPVRLAAAGLTDVGAESELPMGPGGSAGPELLALTILQLRDRLLAGGATAEELDEWTATLADPDQWFPFIALTAAWARRR
ncbi:MAG: class I SAM-dependent methyltransferase [Sporichthyaceae bacterium]